MLVRRTRNNERDNAISRLSNQIAGGARKYYGLTVGERLEIRATATQMYALGVNFSLAASVEPIDKRGFVYVITNKAWPAFVKVGRAFDPESRLRSYQTGCPMRDYVLRYAVYFEDCYAAEKSMHYMLDKWRRGGEWYFADVPEATQLIDKLRETT